MIAAIIQMRSGLKPDDNAATLEIMIKDAVNRGATYIQTPEMTGCLHSSRATLFDVIKPQDEDVIVKMAQTLSRELNVTIHIGSTAIRLDEERVANRAFLFGSDGQLLGSYDKIHMFDVDLDHGETWRESGTYDAGDHAVVADLGFAKIGLAICYDVRFPHLFRDHALAGAHILTAPAAFTYQTGEAHWHVLQRARAIENGAFMISAAQGGHHEDGRETYGHSIVVDPWGKVIAEVSGQEPGIALAPIHIGQSDAARAKIPNLKNARDYGVKAI